jgi:hypothetical protein
MFLIFPYPAQHVWVAVAGVLSATFTYLGVGIAGVPLFRFFHSRHLTAVWIAGAAGFVIGAAMWLAFIVFLGLALGEGFGSVAFVGQDWRSQVAFLSLPGCLGALVGLTLWVIARPDRTP